MTLGNSGLASGTPCLTHQRGSNFHYQSLYVGLAPCAELVNYEEDQGAAHKTWAELELRFGLIGGLVASFEPAGNGKPDFDYAHAVSEGWGISMGCPSSFWGAQGSDLIGYRICLVWFYDCLCSSTACHHRNLLILHPADAHLQNMIV